MNAINETDENEMKLYSSIDLMRFFGEFQRGMDEMEKLAKRLKRKKIEFDQKEINDAIDHFRNREREYYRGLRKLNRASDEEGRETYREELSFFVQNYVYVREEMLNWEFKMEDEHNDKSGTIQRK